MRAFRSLLDGDVSATQERKVSPAMMAEITPVTGGAPEAMVMPSDNGNDTSATCNPASRS